MSLRANDALGVTQKTGVYSRARIGSSVAARFNGHCPFLNIIEMEGNDIDLFNELGGSPPAYTGFIIKTPGIYLAEVSGLYIAAGSIAFAINKDKSPAAAFPTVESGNLYMYSNVGTQIVPITTAIIAKGDEIITIFSNANPAANGEATFTLTKIG